MSKTDALQGFIAGTEDRTDAGPYGGRQARLRVFKFVILSALASIVLLSTLHLLDSESESDSSTTPPSFAHLAAHCASIAPIPASEFHARQQRLADVLHANGAAAYIAEPGASAQFFGNVSAGKWHLSERPLLLIVTPETQSTGTGKDGGSTKVSAKVSVLTPTFEATRAKLLPVPAEGSVTYVDWPEDADPYAVAAKMIVGEREGEVYVDNSVRKFIADGLATALPENKVVSAPLEVRSLRERKSPAEIDILRCANEVTLLAIREVRKHIKVGSYESDVRALVSSALSSAGLSDAGGLVLFGENAALPHGSGTNRQLGATDFVLIDCGGTLHEYHSDITRTFALDSQSASTIPEGHRQIWDEVHAAQTRAMEAARNGSLTRGVDEAARASLEDAGYGAYFTHRLGHGLGLEEHESPYLRGGSADVLRAGHVFSNEPGVYVEGALGVRLEDAFFINDAGEAEYLTEGVGGQAASAWAP